MSSPSVTILGLGIMGTGMARRLLARFPLTVWNRNPQRCEPLAAEGAAVAKTPREAVVKANVIISMVADDVASKAVWLGQEGALAGVTPGATLIECSTLTVGWVRELAAKVESQNKQLEFTDAPVTGSKAQAAAGELNFLVGCSGPTPSKTALHVLEPMAKSIIHLGPTGSGALVKLINNFVCGVQAVALAEAIAWIERTDLDRDKALAFLTTGAAGSPLVKTLAPRMTARDFTPNFLLRLMAKDIGYAVNEAKQSSLDLTTARTVLETVRKSIEAGHGEKDFSAVVEAVRQSR